MSILYYGHGHIQELQQTSYDAGGFRLTSSNVCALDPSRLIRHLRLANHGLQQPTLNLTTATVAERD